MTKAVEEAGKLIFKGTSDENPVSTWKDPDILKRLKGLIKKNRLLLSPVKPLDLPVAVTFDVATSDIH